MYTHDMHIRTFYTAFPLDTREDVTHAVPFDCTFSSQLFSLSLNQSGSKTVMAEDEYIYTLSAQDAQAARAVAHGEAEPDALSSLANTLRTRLEGPTGLVVVRQLLPNDERIDSSMMGRAATSLVGHWGSLLPQSRDLGETVGEVTQHDRSAYGKTVYRG